MKLILAIILKRKSDKDILLKKAIQNDVELLKRTEKLDKYICAF